MKLGSLLAQLERVECYVAIYDDLIAYLDKVQSGDRKFDILMSSGDGVVPADRVVEVQDFLKQKREEFSELLGDAEEMEVGDVELDFGGS